MGCKSRLVLKSSLEKLFIVESVKSHEASGWVAVMGDGESVRSYGASGWGGGDGEVGTAWAEHGDRMVEA